MYAEHVFRFPFSGQSEAAIQSGLLSIWCATRPQGCTPLAEGESCKISDFFDVSKMSKFVVDAAPSINDVEA